MRSWRYFQPDLERAVFVFFYKIAFRLTAPTERITGVFGAVGMAIVASEKPRQRFVFASKRPSETSVQAVIRVFPSLSKTETRLHLALKNVAACFADVVENTSRSIRSQNRGSAAAHCFEAAERRIRPQKPSGAKDKGAGTMGSPSSWIGT